MLFDFFNQLDGIRRFEAVRVKLRTCERMRDSALVSAARKMALFSSCRIDVRRRATFETEALCIAALPEALSGLERHVVVVDVTLSRLKRLTSSRGSTVEANGAVTWLQNRAFLAVLSSASQTAIEWFRESDEAVSSWAEFRALLPVFVQLRERQRAPADFCTLLYIAGERSR